MHQPLHQVVSGTSVQTGGRVVRDGENVWLTNALARLQILGKCDAPDGALVRVAGEVGKRTIRPDVIEVVGEPRAGSTFGQGPGPACLARDTVMRAWRAWFQDEGFLEVETPNLVEAAGTDPYIAPVQATPRVGGVALDRYLHTSPEFAMKRLLSEGMERIYQFAKVYRDGEVGPQHNPEFTIVEWYRAWEDMRGVVDDVEALVKLALPRFTDTTFARRTMADVVEAACGVDILRHADAASLARACRDVGALRRTDDKRWDELFFELLVTHVDPYLCECGPTFVTHWPASQAVLARKDPHDPRVALRFELYVDGVELANGFEELTDPEEQRARFEEDNALRARLGLAEMPMPEAFLRALEYGMPPSAGVAVGFDRVLMLREGASDLAEVVPFAWPGGRG